MFNETSYPQSDGLGTTVLVPRTADQSDPKTEKRLKKISKWGWNVDYPTVMPAPADPSTPTAPPSAPAEESSGGGIGDFFSNLPSWALPAGLILGAYLIFKRR
jgi:hypothetical protein